MQTNTIEKAERVILSCRHRYQLMYAARYAQLALKEHGKNGDEALLHETLLYKQYQLAPALVPNTEQPHAN